MISVFRTKLSVICLAFTLFCLIIVVILSRPSPGLRVKSDVKGAEVFLDGKSIGVAPVDVAPSEGVHTLTLRKAIDAEKYYYYESEITIQKGESLKIDVRPYPRFTAEAAKGFVDSMVYVKGGCFQMGDVFGDHDKYIDAGSPPHIKTDLPVHEVCLDDFSIGKYEVTQAEWQKVMGKNPSRSVHDRLPIENITKDEMLEFISKLNTMTGHDYRLPTEAEWEYAARSGGKNERWAGTSNESELTEYAWYKKNSAYTTHFVGLKRPNSLGLYDMSGNVSEMVQDGQSPYTTDPQRNPQAPSGVAGRHTTIDRGGCYGDIPYLVRTFDRGFRGRRFQATAGGTMGFRLAQSHRYTSRP